jgi:molybdenum cofactor guanylyltransferase
MGSARKRKAACESCTRTGGRGVTAARTRRRASSRETTGRGYHGTGHRRNLVPVHADTTLAILCGGRATRLGGAAKGLLLREGRPLIDRLVALGEGFAEVLLVAEEPGPYLHRWPRLRPIADAFPGKGAPGALVSALEAARTPRVLGVACDMPFLELEALELLFEALSLPSALCASFELAGTIEPLPLLCVREPCLSRWQPLLEQDPSFRDLFHAVRSVQVEESRLRSVDPDARTVVSVNSPEDCARWGISRALP